MNGLIRRMCILKQLKTGFSADGNPLSGVVRVEKYGRLCTVQLSLINFAPLSDGRYVCVLCDKQGERLVFPLSALAGEYRAEDSDFTPEKGFCAVVCFVKTAAECLAAGQYGGGVYNRKVLLDGLGFAEKKESDRAEKKVPAPRKDGNPPAGQAPAASTGKGGFTAGNVKEKEIVFVTGSDPVLKRGEEEENSSSAREIQFVQKSDFADKVEEENQPPMPEEKTETRENELPMPEGKGTGGQTAYDDEAVSLDNYFSEEEQGENGGVGPAVEDEDACAACKEAGADGKNAAKNDAAEDVCHPFAFTDGQSYYLKVKDELEALFSSGERADVFRNAFPQSEWVRVADSGGCLVGVVYENFRPRYIAYALPARGTTPPEEIGDACFVPVDPLSDGTEGYFVLFQDAATGESVTVGRG